jgi:hypothetical protein
MQTGILFTNIYFDLNLCSEHFLHIPSSSRVSAETTDVFSHFAQHKRCRQLGLKPGKRVCYLKGGGGHGQLSLEAVNLPATTTGPGKLFQSDGLWEE